MTLRSSRSEAETAAALSALGPIAVSFLLCVCGCAPTDDVDSPGQPASDAGAPVHEGVGPGEPRPAPQARAVALSLGRDHTCALTEHGRVVCWGDATHGQLGLGSTETIGDDEAPGSAGAVRLGSRAVSIAAGAAHTCALLDDGRVHCWGQNDYGQLGLGHVETVGDDEYPDEVAPIDFGEPATAVVAGDRHTCVLLAGGRVRCWGRGDGGQLGYGAMDSIGDDEPASAAPDVPIGGAVAALSLGQHHTCAALVNGAVRCWGYSDFGEVGYVAPSVVGDDEQPADVGDVPLGTSARGVSVGTDHSCAVDERGAVRCWGSSEDGALGYGNSQDIGFAVTPAEAGDVVLPDAVVDVEAGDDHTCAMTVSGLAYCWGLGDSGRLGYGDEESLGDDEPLADLDPVSLGGAVQAMAAGGAHTCALLETGGVRCWGDASMGQLGYGNSEVVGDDELPSDAPEVSLGPSVDEP